MLIHPHQGAERPREQVGDRARAALPGDLQDKLGDIAAAIVLGDQDIDVAARGPTAC